MFRRYLTSIGGRVLGALAQTAVLALLARSLGIPLFGTFAVALGVAQLAFVFLDLGFGTRLLQLRDDPRAKGLFGALVVLRGAAVLLAFAAAAVAAVLIGGTAAGVVAATAVYATGEMVGDSAILVFQGELRPRSAVAVLLARRLVALVPFALGIAPGPAIAALVAAGLAGHAAFWPTVLSRAGRPMPLGQVVRVNGTIVLLTGGTSVTLADSLVVSTVAGSALVSAYAAASRLSNPVNLAISTMVQVLIPELATATRARAREQFRRARRIVALLAVLVAATSTLSPVIVALLYGPAFAATTPILAGVIVGAAISALSQIHLAYLLAHGPRAADGVLLASASALGLAALGVSAALAGVTGCAVGYVLMEACILAGMLIAYRGAARRVDAAEPSPT